MPNPNGAGELPLDVELTGVVQIKKGNIQDCPRRGAKSNVAVRVSDGYGVLRARVDQLVRPQGVPADFTLYFKQTKNAVQSDYQPITEDNFEEWLRARWAKITRAEVDKWAEDQGKEPREIPVFEFFVYKPRQQVSQARRIHRATARRIEAARDRLQQHNNQYGVHMGEIQLNHVAMVNARRPDDEEIMIPDDPTNRQARELDREREQLQNEDEQAAAARNAELQPIQIQLNGTMVEVQVNVRSLRQAVGLPNQRSHEWIPMP